MDAKQKGTNLGQLEMLAERAKARADALAEQIKGVKVPVKVSELENDVKFQTEEQVVAAVAAANHLSRKIVTGVDAIDPAAEGAEKFIYMVPKTGSDEDDQYDEYMVLDGSVEHVGNTKVDLSGYVQKEEGKGLSANDFTDEDKAKLDGVEFATDAEVETMLDAVFGAVAEAGG